MHDFWPDLEKSQGPRAMAALNACYPVAYPGIVRRKLLYDDMESQERGFDVLAVLNDATDRKVEEKVRWRRYCKDFLIECLADLGKGTPGWWEKDPQCDDFLAVWVKARVALRVDRRTLQGAYEANMGRWFTRAVSGKDGFMEVFAKNRSGYTTWSMAIPTHELTRCDVQWAEVRF